MRVHLLSDAHLTGLDDPAQDDLVRWLDQLHCDRLVLLGDLFHAWWGFPGVVWSGYVPVCAALLRARRRGVQLFFVPGNHDFTVGTFLADEVGLQVRGTHVQVIGGLRFLLSHGDEVDDSAGYRVTRAVLRGRPFAGLLRILGPARSHVLLLRLAGASRHQAHDPSPLLDRQRAWADRRLGVDADVVVMGHIHVPALERRRGGIFVNLGDWAEHRSWLEVGEGRLVLRQGLEGAVLAELPMKPTAGGQPDPSSEPPG
ncbi:UDP-2,3-diacylglucosamine diphosphatase [Myxococcota bacterium]|nr:UDP-2,3-diacylglucosamine diphosphatase [Myxococcota bacterium]